jgi:hypothetical protein
MTRTTRFSLFLQWLIVRFIKEQKAGLDAGHERKKP